MSKISTQDRIKKFIKLFPTEIINSKLVIEFCNKLVEMDYFIAPSSTKYHSAYEGGLFDHSYKVTKKLLYLTEKLNLKWEREISPYIVGLFHDLCKCDSYLYDIETDSYIHNTDCVLTGHGDKSVILAQRLFPLTKEEELCIRWHMGAYDNKENWRALNNAIKEYPNVLFTHTADMMASQFEED